MSSMVCKESCDGCSECHTTPNPYDKQLHAVWHDPTEYNVIKHGPPYLKLGSDQKASVAALVRAPLVQKALAKQAAYYDTLPVAGEALRPLSWLLAAMRALTLSHQTHHWQTMGGHFYGDHLLFKRLYEESLPFIDDVAERAVGAGSSELVDARQQIDIIRKILDLVPQNTTELGRADQAVAVSLFGETLLLGFLADVIKRLKATGSLTPGINNLLEGVADKHEQFVYLLKQRSTQTPAAYSYDRG